MNNNEVLGILSKNIKRYLEEYGMSQADLARKLGVSAQTITNWVRGAGNPRMNKIDKMCEIFLCNRSDLLEDNQDAPRAKPRELLGRSAAETIAIKFRRLDVAEQALIMDMVDFFLEAKKKKETVTSAS